MARAHRRTDRPPSLAIDRLRVEIATQRGPARVVDDVSLEVWPGEIVGVIGESGSGKTMTALSVLGLMPRRARIAAGEIRLGSDTITHLPDAARRRLRGDRIAFIPQDALRALNPVLRVDLQVGEPAQHPSADTVGSRRRRGRSNCCGPSISGSPSSGRANIRTSSPVACSSAP